MSLARYSEYRPSGVSWLGDIPAHWRLSRLKQVCEVFPSNVDKKSVDGETPVLLCNYTDVYYNDVITADMDFMPATATSEQIGRFTLRAGDTIITKDSETADDIAISAFVPVDMPGVVCGYHLSMIRPSREAEGRFVKRLFDAAYTKAAVAVQANGLTRVGLGQYALDNLEVPLPPLREQTQIATFLQRETAKIDALVAEQRRLMALLREKRQAVISHAVTKGLNLDAPMKDSRVEWLGDVPAHWEIGPIKRFMRSLNPRRVPLSSEERSGRQGEYPYYGASGIIDSVDDFLFDAPTVLVSEDGANLLGRATPISFVATGRYWVNNHAHILQPPDEAVRFWAERIECIDVAPFVTGSAQPKLTSEALMNLTIAAPPTSKERIAIAERLEHEEASLAALMIEAGRAIDLLLERRAAMITAAVTGQIDVRHLATVDDA